MKTTVTVGLYFISDFFNRLQKDRYVAILTTKIVNEKWLFSLKPFRRWKHPKQILLFIRKWTALLAIISLHNTCVAQLMIETSIAQKFIQCVRFMKRKRGVKCYLTRQTEHFVWLFKKGFEMQSSDKVFPSEFVACNVVSIASHYRLDTKDLFPILFQLNVNNI